MKILIALCCNWLLFPGKKKKSRPPLKHSLPLSQHVMWCNVMIYRSDQAAVAKCVHPVSCIPLVIDFFAEMIEGFHPSQHKKGIGVGAATQAFASSCSFTWSDQCWNETPVRLALAEPFNSCSHRWLHQPWAPTGGLGCRGQLTDVHCIPTGSVVLSHYIRGTYQDTFPVPRSSDWFGSMIRMMLNQWECIRK